MFLFVVVLYKSGFFWYILLVWNIWNFMVFVLVFVVVLISVKVWLSFLLWLIFVLVIINIGVFLFIVLFVIWNFVIIFFFCLVKYDNNNMIV